MFSRFMVFVAIELGKIEDFNEVMRCDRNRSHLFCFGDADDEKEH